MVVYRTRTRGDRYITSWTFNAEEILGKYCNESQTFPLSIDFNDITEFYIIDTNIDYDITKIARIAMKKY